MGTQVAYLSGLTMRRVADLHPGEAKTGARDAFIIAETTRTMPSRPQRNKHQLLLYLLIAPKQITQDIMISPQPHRLTVQN